MDNKQVENLIGAKIKKLRLKFDLTQEALARKAYIPYTTLTKVESGIIKSPYCTCGRKSPKLGDNC